MSQLFKAGDTVRRINSNFGFLQTEVKIGETYIVKSHERKDWLELNERDGKYVGSNFELVTNTVKVRGPITEEVCTRLVGLRDAHTAKVAELQEFREAFKHSEQILLSEVTEILEMIVEIKTQYGVQ